MRAMSRAELAAVTLKQLLERVRARVGVASAAALKPCKQTLKRIFTACLAEQRANDRGDGDDDGDSEVSHPPAAM